MGRLVQPARTTVVQSRGGLEGVEGPAATPATTRELGDTYLERVAKYVPAEIIAFFIFANSILKEADKPGATMAGFSVVTIGMVVFLGAWLFTPIYLAQAARADDAWITNAVVATLLFPVWAYAVEGVGPVHVIPFDGSFASIVVGAASLVSGLVKPREQVVTQDVDAHAPVEPPHG